MTAYDVVAKMTALASPGEKLQASRAVIRLYGADMPATELATLADDQLRNEWAAKAKAYDARPQAEKDAAWKASKSYVPSYEGMQSKARRGALDDKREGAFDLLGAPPYGRAATPEELAALAAARREGAIAHAATVLVEEAGFGRPLAIGTVTELLIQGLSVEELESLSGEDGSALLRRLEL